MFIGREDELEVLKGQLSSDGKAAVLVYGKRRVGKSTLIAKAAEGFDGVVVSHLCVQSSFEGNLEYLGRSISRALGLPKVRFDALQDAFDYLGTLGRRVLVVLDEYQYLKDSLRKGEVDSLMQLVVDTLPPNVKVVLCGSYVTVMRELLEEENPLFGRFTSIVHVEDFDYRDAARFYPGAEPNEKVALYSVFGGSPYVLSSLDPGAGVRANVERLLLSPTGLLRTHVENVMLKGVGKACETSGPTGTTTPKPGRTGSSTASWTGRAGSTSMNANTTRAQ